VSDIDWGGAEMRKAVADTRKEIRALEAQLGSVEAQERDLLAWLEQEAKRRPLTDAEVEQGIRLQTKYPEGKHD
jgi:hypothetical protein